MKRVEQHEKKSSKVLFVEERVQKVEFGPKKLFKVFPLCF